MLSLKYLQTQKSAPISFLLTGEKKLARSLSLSQFIVRAPELFRQASFIEDLAWWLATVRPVPPMSSKARLHRWKQIIPLAPEQKGNTGEGEKQKAGRKQIAFVACKITAEL